MDKNKTAVLLYFLAITVSLIAVMCQIEEALSYDIWVDEAFSLRMIQHPYQNMIQLTAQDVHPPLYYIILKFGVDFLKLISGDTPEIFLAKLVSIVPFVLVLLLNCFWIRYKWGMEVSAFFSLCIAGAPQLTEYAVDIRMYGYAFLFVTVTFLILFELIREESYSWLKGILFAGFSVMAAYTHYFALVSVGIAYVLLLVDILKKRRQFQDKIKFIVLAFIAVLCYLPWIFVLLRQIVSVKASYWIEDITIKTIWGYVLFAFDNIYCLLIFICVIGREIISKKIPNYIKSVLLYCILCPVGTVLVGIVASIIIRPVFVERYMVPSLGTLWFAFCISLALIKDKEYRYFIFLLSLVFCINHVSNFVISEDTAKIESERLITALKEEDNSIYVFENARARNVMAALTGRNCYQFKEGIDELSLSVYENLGTINMVEEISTFIRSGISAYWVETIDGSDLFPEDEIGVCGMQYKEIGKFSIENTIAKQNIIIYKLELL